MKITKYRDLFISSFLIISLAIGAFIVSCSEEDGLLMGPGNNGIGNPFSTEDTETSAITSIFTNIAEGAEGQVGSDITGWVLGAMGIAGSSGPNYSQQIAKISAQLDSIISLLGDVDNELNQINQTLLVINCSEQTSSLQNEIGEIRELYNQYNGMLSVANVGDTLSDTTMRNWSDRVLGNTPGWTSIGEQLSTIETNLESNTGAVYSCVKALTLPPENMLHGDTSYYNNVDAITNFYYYWQSIGLLLVNEANHYYAWVEAGRPGGNTLSADSIQAVCGSNGNALLYCNDAAIETNQLYNSLITQMTYGGAQYTNNYYIFQYSSTNPVVWTRSLEDFTTQAGYTNCRMPLYNGEPCGPAAGYFYTKLEDTTYRGLSGLTFANSTDLVQWIDVNAASSYSAIYEYLDAQGFNSMISKTVIASDSIVITFFDANVTTAVVPFFTSNESVQDMYNHPTAVVQDATTFSWVFYPKNQGESGLCGYLGAYAQYPYNYYTNSGYNSHDSWTNGTATLTKCSDGSYPTSFHFTSNPVPGFVAEGQRNQSVGKRYLWPVVHAKTTKCTNGRSQLGPGGMATICSDNFTAFLNTNVPRPPTCKNTSLNTPCVTLN